MSTGPALYAVGSPPPHQHDDPAIDAESEYLSASLAIGQWCPSAHGLSAKHFPTYSRAYRFCDDHMAVTGQLPTPDKVARHDPNFIYDPGVQPGYAAKLLREDRFFTELANASLDLAAAAADRSLIRAIAARDLVATLTPDLNNDSDIDMTDASLYVTDTAGLVFPTSSSALNAALDGGFYEGTLTVATARTNQGKSWWLMQRALDAALHGCQVLYITLEMGALRCNARFARLLFGTQVDAWSHDQLRTAVIERHAPAGGTIRFRSGTQGSITPSAVASAAQGYDVVVVDYAGLMKTDAGESHATSWNAAAEIVSGLQHAAQLSGSPVLTAAQLNRSSKRPSMHEVREATSVVSGSSANIANMAHTDKYAHDADVVLALHRMSGSVTLNLIEKNRHGPLASSWFTRFVPSEGNFADLSSDEAMRIVANETGEE